MINQILRKSLLAFSTHQLPQFALIGRFNRPVMEAALIASNHSSAEQNDMDEFSAPAPS
jgi:hypothetical protein